MYYTNYKNLKERLQVFRESKIIIGVSGSSFFNWNIIHNKDTKVIEIINRNLHEPHFGINSIVYFLTNKYIVDINEIDNILYDKTNYIKLPINPL